ncbi:hypothetical protein F5148DRAFT_1154061 [Russula earlei]|uniref:Uncharacterized protein n=1 Tax=Russula earlei TaxID=71964 RepID=A0ACC0TS84_9AGAM|nr:hypothetical protein F5148DRAFT_1154061 [Russula earlei]
MDDLDRLRILDSAIPSLQNTISLLPRSEPRRALRVQFLALARRERHGFTRQQDDLEQAILLFTEAIFLPLPWDGCPLNIVDIFFLIIVSFILETGKPEDVKWGIRYLRYLHDQPFMPFDFPRSHVTKILVESLVLQMKLDPGDVIGDIDEMAGLCHELLHSDISKASLTTTIKAFVDAVLTHFGTQSESMPSEKVIGCLRKANQCLPDLHLVSIALTKSLHIRFRTTLLNDDYEEAMVILDPVISIPAGDRPSEFQGPALASLDDPIRPHLIKELATMEGQRDVHFAVTGGNRDPRLAFQGCSGFPQIPPFRDLSVSLSQSCNGSSNLTAISIEQHMYALVSYRHITEMADIEEAIKYYRLVIASSAIVGHGTATLAGNSLGKVLQKAFSCTRNVDYLTEAISVLRDLLSITDASGNHFMLAGALIEPLYARFLHLHYEEDLDEMMQLCHVAVNNQRVTTPVRLNALRLWARVTHNFGHPSTSTAYDTVISLMQDSLTFTPTLESQHSRLVVIPSDQELPLDYASYLVHTGRPEKAIEILERGRSLLWSEMRGLRTSIDRLHSADPQLANKFAAVNRDLEMVTLNTDGDRGDGGLDDTDQMGLLLLPQKKLLDDRDGLISKVRSLPGFESFLKAPSFDTLRFAALNGPVIVINHSKRGSDILILHHNSPPSIIPTANDFYDRAIQIRDRLVKCRSSDQHGLDSKQYQQQLRSVLSGLYDIVGQPVIERLRFLKIPEQSRVWWLPTSVFCSLPLHAMGPIPSCDGRRRYFLDLYIPSYTPTLSALIESRKPSKETFEKPSGPSHGTARSISPRGVARDRYDTRAQHKCNNTYVKQSNAFCCCGEPPRPSVFPLQHGKPFDASFKLHNDERLTLLDLIQSQLPAAEFAFLSACHTAELTEGSIADEALHLTAAMQYCGFRSVVGTMWGMADSDGPELVGHFYKSLFSKSESGSAYYERSARALRNAMRGLRKKGLPLERWVNFVHYGA